MLAMKIPRPQANGDPRAQQIREIAETLLQDATLYGAALTALGFAVQGLDDDVLAGVLAQLERIEAPDVVKRLVKDALGF